MGRRLVAAAAVLVVAGAGSSACRRCDRSPPPPSPEQSQQRLAHLVELADGCLHTPPLGGGQRAAAATKARAAAVEVCAGPLRERLTALTPSLRARDELEIARLLGELLDVELELARAEAHDAPPAASYRLALRRACLDTVEPAAIYESALARLGELQGELRQLMAAHGRRGEPGPFLEALARERRTEPLVALARRAFARLLAASSSLGAEPSGATPCVVLGSPGEGRVEPVQLVEGDDGSVCLELDGVPGDYGWLAVDAATAAETFPGRLLAAELATVDGAPSLLGIRLELPVYDAGWRLHAARLARDLGGYAEPAAEVGMITFEAVATVRAAVDVGIHGLGLELEQARTLYRGHTLLDDERIALELTAIQRRPGQAAAAYVGAQAFARLASATRRRLGERFELGPFYAALLGGGPVDETGLAVAAERYRRVVEAAIP